MSPFDGTMTDASSLIDDPRAALGAKYVLTGARQTARYRKGFRFGYGPVLAVLRPGSLVEQWRALCLCQAAGVIIIMQAANTGLTGGSPRTAMITTAPSSSSTPCASSSCMCCRAQNR